MKEVQLAKSYNDEPVDVGKTDKNQFPDEDWGSQLHDEDWGFQVERLTVMFQILVKNQ